MREMLRIVLRRDGYDVTVAANGRQAIDILAARTSGSAALGHPDARHQRRRRAARGQGGQSRLVAFMMTAFASTETAVEAMRLGAVDYFTKPFSMDEMRLKVRQHVETLRLKQENVLLKRALNTQQRVLQHHRSQRADARGLQDDRDHRQDQQHRADYRRVRDGQGPGGARRPLQLAAPRAAVRRA